MKQNNAIYAVLLLAIIGTAFIALMSWEDQPPAPVVTNEKQHFRVI